MPEDNKQNKESDFPFPPWLKASMEVWSNITKTIPKPDFAEAEKQSASNNRLAEQWQRNVNLMKSFSKLMSEPEAATTAMKAMNTLPEIIFKMAKSGWEASFQLQKNVLEKAGKIRRHTEAYNFDNIDQETFKVLTDVYEKELRQYFNIPPLGLTRFYQERFNKFLDKQNTFETKVAEFLSIIYLPIEKSFKALEEKLQAMAKEGILPKEVKENYAIWLKILEGHYMKLFQSKDYTDALHDTLEKMEDYLLAKDEAMRDFLQFFPVPTNKDMDELYKELHLLKKRVKELEKNIKSA